MDFLFDCCIWISQHLRPWLAEISGALVVSGFVLAADSLLKFLKRAMGSAPFPVRVALFALTCMLVCAAGLHWAIPIVRFGLGRLSNLALFPVLATLFLVIGWGAEKRRMI